MGMQQIAYKEARPKMKPGDVIAFGGTGATSWVIKKATCSMVSHVGVILQTKVLDEDEGRFFNLLIESIGSGVRTPRLSFVLENCGGSVWWLPLRKDLRENSFDATKFYNFLYAQEGKAYDSWQAARAGVDKLDKLFAGIHGPSYNREDFDKFFCSELVAAGFEKSGIIENVNASEVTPIDLCRWNIFEDDYYQLYHVKPKEISDFNTCEPANE